MSKQPTLVEKYPVINRFVNSRIQSEGFVRYFCHCVSLRGRVCLGRVICLSKVRFSSAFHCQNLFFSLKSNLESILYRGRSLFSLALSPSMDQSFSSKLQPQVELVRELPCLYFLF